MRFPPLSKMILFVLVFGALALFSMTVRDPVTHSTLIWPAGGILLGTLILAPRSQWLAWGVIAAIVHLAAGLLMHRPLAVSALFVVVNLLTEGATAALWRVCTRGKESLTDPRGLLWFVLLVAAGSIGGSVLGWAGLQLLGNIPVGISVEVLTVSRAVGALIGAPLVLAWAGFQPRRSNGRGHGAQGLIWFIGLVLSAELAFDGSTAQLILHSTSFELSYLPLVFMVLVAVAWQQRGTTAALLVLGAIACVNTANGEGPFARSHELFGNALLEVQLYLAVAALLGLLMSVLNASREQALRDAVAWKVRSEGMLLGTCQLMYEVDPANHQIVWAGDLSRLLALQAAELANLAEFFERVHPDDRDRVIAYAGQRQAGDITARTQTFRFLAGDGEYVQLQDIGAPVVDFDDSVYRISGLLRLDDSVSGDEF
ncbi:MASE1 domain-containing protein [Silvimonas soli]|uniref:MASE1 domain-containing protein n=1 Tax=Silvimonas soli TaxID=2980100 RepID=UPI0024B34A33|nr:MASE1 domain-containing protein [Silvimonas soli]